MATIVVSTLTTAQLATTVAGVLCDTDGDGLRDDPCSVVIRTRVDPQDSGPDELPPVWFRKLGISPGSLQLLAHAMSAAVRRPLSVVVFANGAVIPPLVHKTAVYRSPDIGKGFSTVFAWHGRLAPVVVEHAPVELALPAATLAVLGSIKTK
jgi:hypothetical protein